MPRNAATLDTDVTVDRSAMTDGFENALVADSASVATRLAEEALRDARAYQEQMNPESPTANKASIMKHNAYWRMCTRGLPNSLRGKTICNKAGHAKRQGWVVIGPSVKGPGGRDQCAQFEAVMHAESLEEKYGGWELDEIDQPNSMRHIDLTPNLPYGPFANLILHESGTGLFEFPVSQFLAHRWDKIPNLLKNRKDVQEWLDTVGFLRCEFCINREFILPENLEAHRRSMHEEQRQGLANGREFGRAMLPLQDALEKLVATNSSSGDMVAAISLLTEVVAQNQQLLAAQNAKN